MRATTTTDHLLRGYKDYEDDTPWAHAPISYEDWRYHNAVETPEQIAYWNGFNAGLMDATR